MVTTKIFYEYRTRAGCHEPAMLARFGWTFERFRSPLHFWYVVLKLRSVWICAISTMTKGTDQIFWARGQGPKRARGAPPGRAVGVEARSRMPHP